MEKDRRSGTGIFLGIVFIIGLSLIAQSSIFHPDISPVSSKKSSEKKFSIPLFFESNVGQAPSSARFVSHGRGYSLSLTPSEAAFALRPSRSADQERRVRSEAPASDARNILRMQFVGSDPDAEMIGSQPMPGKVHYLKGKDPEQWHKNIPLYSQVRYENIYPDIDLVFYGTSEEEKQLEYDFVVRPGADPGKICLDFKGAEKLSIDENGQLILHMADGGRIFQKVPTIYQESDGQRQPVAGSYKLEDHNRVTFQLAGYDPDKTLVIDPVLVYSTYLGGDDHDGGRGVAVDSSGNVYMTGWTDSFDFSFPVDGYYAGSDRDVFVAAFNSDGSQLLYYSIIGGEDMEHGRSIAVDSRDNAYVTGWTDSSEFPVISPFQNVRYGGRDAFVFKLSSDGSLLIYSTYLGGDLDDEAYSVVVDTRGNASVTGYTLSRNFPVFRAYQDRLDDDQDVFVTKFDDRGSDILYSTYIGGEDNEVGRGIAQDSSGLLYITGSTYSSDYPVLNPFMHNTEEEDAFITKINPDQKEDASLLYSTYLGGRDEDRAEWIAVDNSGTVYVTGGTGSTDFPVANAYDGNHSGSTDVFVTKLSTITLGPSALFYSTFLGGSAVDVGRGIALDGSGNIYVTGGTESNDFPVKDAIDSNRDGNTEVFVSMLNPFLKGRTSLVYSTYLGDDRYDEAFGIALDNKKDVYVVGETSSSNFHIKNAFQSEKDNLNDAFLAKIGSTESGVPTVGGAAEGANVERNISTASVSTIILLLSQQAPNINGRLYISIEVPTIPEVAGMTFFRPSDSRTPPFVILANAGTGFLPGAEELFFSQGFFADNAPDLSFIVNTDGLQGQSVIFRTLYLQNGLTFEGQNLRTIQTVRVNFTS